MTTHPMTCGECGEEIRTDLCSSCAPPASPCSAIPNDSAALVVAVTDWLEENKGTLRAPWTFSHAKDAADLIEAILRQNTPEHGQA